MGLHVQSRGDVARQNTADLLVSVFDFLVAGTVAGPVGGL